MMSKLPFVRFAIDTRPCCLWDQEIRRVDSDFIDSIDPRFFEQIANIHGQLLEGDERQYAATALRITYSHALESLFAILSATIQAPDCISGWLLRYQPRELRSFVQKVIDRESVYSKLRITPVSWRALADAVHSLFSTGDRDKDIRIRASFGHLWERFAMDLLDENLRNEYNSMKHGLRVSMGGFYFAVGAEETRGVPAPPDRMMVMAQSEFGSSFLVPEQLHDKRN